MKRQLQDVETPNGIYQVWGELTPELIKRLSKPYRKPPIQKPLCNCTIEEAENHGVKFPTRERSKEKNLLRCSRFNARFQELSETKFIGLAYQGIENPIYNTRFNFYNHEEERDALLKRHGVKLTGLAQWERNDVARKILLDISRSIQDDFLQEESGDSVNREKCRIWNERYFALGGIGSGYKYMGNEEPELQHDYSREEVNGLLVRNKVKLTGLSEKKRVSLCGAILSGIQTEVVK